jgi:hypothetical protein
MQLSQTQEELSQQLHLDLQPDVEIKRLRIQTQTPLLIQNLQAFRVSGVCDYGVQLAARSRIEHNVPFEVFLQRQSEAKTWRLALQKPQDGEFVWVTQRIPTDKF